MIPAKVAMLVANNTGTNTSVGCAAPSWARYTMMPIGMMTNPEVFSTRNMIIGLLAVSFLGFSSCNPSMAFKPRGVAALSSPSILAARFMKILPVTGCPLGISGNSLLNIGLSSREMRVTKPPRSPIFMIPNHKESTPVKPNEISKAVWAELKVELMISGNTCVSPAKTKRPMATINAIRKKAIQI